MANLEQVKQWLQEIAYIIAHHDDPAVHHYVHFIQEPDLALVLVDVMAELPDSDEEKDRAYYSACIFALDICVSQLQSARENGNKQADKMMNNLMASLAEKMSSKTRSLMFWLPVLNAFYDVHVELSPQLKNAYLDLVDEEEDQSFENEVTHLHSIRELIQDLSGLSVFDMAEHFFAQSYAMPPDFLGDLVLDLYQLEEGRDVGLLALMHPNAEAREMVVDALDSIMPDITLSSISLSRLQTITSWYPTDFHPQLNGWIKAQRKKGVIFQPSQPAKMVSIRASEVDGGGAQGIFIHLQRGRAHRLCGLLFKSGFGIKDAWITPTMTLKEVLRYEDEAFDDGMTLRDVDEEYVLMLTNHFLAYMVEAGQIPDLHLLEIQEEAGFHFLPESMDVASLVDDFAVQVSPFTPEVMQASLTRSKNWLDDKRFAESWYLEGARVDKLVNRCCNFVNGVRVCQFEEAMALVFQEAMEPSRARWLFHFLWIALWLKVKTRKHEKAWQDSFFIAYAIHEGVPMREIPLMKAICYESIVNSVETMQARRTHLNQE